MTEYQHLLFTILTAMVRRYGKPIGVQACGYVVTLCTTHEASQEWH